MKKITKVACITAFSSCALFNTAHADILDYNHAFSYSELGAEIISYGETTSFFGRQLDLSQSVVNAGQRSGGYTPFSEMGGFYVQTATTLDPLSATEEWNVAPFGIVQTNERKIRLNELSVSASWLLGDDTGYHIIAGASITSLSFTRSYFKPGAGTPALDAALVSQGFGTLQLPTGSTTEDSTTVVAHIGFRYDSTFIDPDETTRLLWGVIVGIPAYYKVENSNFPSLTWQEYFKGYDVGANIGYGFQIFEKFLLSSHLELAYKKRLETKGIGIGGGLEAKIPEVTIMTARVSMGVEWSY